MTTDFNILSFIKENSLTYTEIKEDYENFINALTEDEKLGFKTLLAGTNAQILIDVLSAKTSDEIYHIIASREEAYLMYCNRIDSATAISQSKGYNVKRGSNIKIRLTITPNTNANLDRFEPICIVDDYVLASTEEVELVAGEQITIDTYLGEVKEQTLVADTEDLLIFRFTNQNVSDQIALYLDGKEVPHTTNILEMLDDKYLCISNAYSSVDALYLNNHEGFTHSYSNGSKLTLKYIEYRNIDLDVVDIECLYGEINDVQQLATTARPEQTISIKTHAQLYSEAQNRIVAREDFPKVLRDFDQTLIDAKGHDFTPAVVETTYVKDDGTLMLTDEYSNCYDYLYKRRGFGIPMCRLEHPDAMKNFNITVFLKLNSGQDTSMLNTIVRNVLAEHECKLGKIIDFSKIENDLESYKVIETARIIPAFTNYPNDTLVSQGTVLKPTESNGKLYVVRNKLNLTGDTEPEWPLEIGATVVDNDIIWKCRERSYTPKSPWLAGLSIVKDMIIQPTNIEDLEYYCYQYNYKNGEVEPNWPLNIGETVVDNQIQWVAIKKDSTARYWQADEIVEKGLVVNTFVNPELSYQAINYVARTPEEEPEWITDEFIMTYKDVQYAVINEIYNPDRPRESNIRLNWNQYATFNETVTVV